MYRKIRGRSLSGPGWVEGWESSQNEIMSSGKVILIRSFPYGRGAGGDVIARECVLSLVLDDWGEKVVRGGGVSSWLTVSWHVLLKMIFYNNEKFRMPGGMYGFCCHLCSLILCAL